MNCAECAHLAAEYERLRRVYVMAIELLCATGYRATDAEHNKLKNAVAEARAQSEIAGFELDKHRFAVHVKAV